MCVGSVSEVSRKCLGSARLVGAPEDGSLVVEATPDVLRCTSALAASTLDGCRRVSAYLGVSRRISANLPLLECFYRGVAADVKALRERLVLVRVHLRSSTAWVLSVVQTRQCE